LGANLRGMFAVGGAVVFLASDRSIADESQSIEPKERMSCRTSCGLAA
jgi:hypothetical protein